MNNLTPLNPETIFRVGTVEITNSLFTSQIIFILLFIFILIVNRIIKTKGTPTISQLYIEGAYSLIFDFINKITTDNKITKKVISFTFALFLFVTVTSLVMLLPGAEGIKQGEVNVFRNPSTDLSVSFGLAVTAIIWAHLSGILDHGIVKHIQKYLKVGIPRKLKFTPMEIIEAVVWQFVGFLDIISELAKSFSLSLRLFGNMYAGQILGILISGVLAVILPIPLMFYGIFTGILQAVVFAGLTSAYYKTAIET